jgi:hypothetical protein
MKSFQKHAWTCSVRALLIFLLSATAAAGFAEEVSSKVEKCSRNFGSIAVSEPQAEALSHLSSYGLGSPAALLRMMIQQSGCFTVLERGVAMQNIEQERALAQGGELRSGSNIGKGQMQGADFVITPSVQFAQNTGGVGAGLMSWGQGLIGKVGALAGNLKFKEAQTSLLLSDVRSSIQVAAAEGTAKKTDFGVGGWSWGGAGAVGLGGYTSTPEGKMVAASLLDNYNKIVASIRDQQSLVRTSNASSDANAAASTQAGISVNGGDMLRPKLNNVRVFAQPSASSKVIGTIQKTEDMVATGEEKAGFLKVDAANISGWVQKTLVMAAADAPPVAEPAPAPAIVPVAAYRTAPVSMTTFTGSYVGDDNGAFTVVVTANGAIMGTGQSGNNVPFRISGRVDQSGAVTMTSTGTAGAASFAGKMDPVTGKLEGNWRLNNGQGSGTFSAQKV